MDNPRIPFKSGVILLCALVSCVYLIRTTSFVSTKTSFQAVAAQASEICASIDTSDSFTQSEIDRASAADDFLMKMRGDNDLLTFGTTTEDSGEFLTNYLIHLIPFIAIGLVVCFFSIICLCCTCCNYGCFRSCSTPTKGNKIVVFSLSLVFSIAMIGLAVTGLIFTDGLKFGFQRASCSIANVLVDLSAGQSSLKWIGLSPATQAIQTVRDSLADTLNGLPDASDSYLSLRNLYDQIKADVQTYYQNSKDRTVPDPESGDITPSFISNLGPETDNTTMSGLIMLEATTKYDIIGSTLQSLSSAINTIKADTSLTSTLESVIQTMTNANTALTDALDSWNSASSTVSSYNGIVSTVIFVFFIVAIILAAIIFLGVLNTFTLKSMLGYKIMIFTRYFLNIILIFLSLAFAVIYPISIGAMEACNAIQETLNDQNLLSQYLQVVSADTEFDDFYTCLYGDGDIMSNLGINSQLFDFSTINDGLDSFNEYANDMTSNFSNSIVIPNQQLYINLFQTGQLPVTDGIESERQTLNGYTNEPDTEGCSQDTWYLNSVNCTTNDGTSFTSSNPATFNYGSPTCIGFDQFASYVASDRYTSTDTTACPNLVDANQLIGGFKTHLNAVNTVFGGLNTDLGTVNTSNNNFMTKVRDTITSFTSLGYEVTNIINIAGNADTGLIANMNCAFVGANARHIVDNICIGYLPILFFTSVFVLAFGIATLCGLLPIFLAGKIQLDEVKGSEHSLDESFSRRYLVEKETIELSDMRL